ncbi:MAG: VWA domain-containing protein [Verrucomicrobium sp.]|nr:VWA domain-containing protein [Verrucomicrobium sp.]
MSAPASIDGFLAELERLAQLVARMPDLVVREGDPGSGWSFNRRDRIIAMDGSRLRCESRDFNRGLVLHELSHAVLTRLQPYLQGDYLTRRDIYMAINAFEDIRIESWMLQRFAGGREWIAEYNGKLLGNTVPAFKQLEWTKLPPLEAFLAAVMARWWHGPEQVTLPKSLVPLVDEAWPHVERIRKAIPAPSHDAVSGRGAAAAYRGSTVQGLHCLQDIISPPDEFEMEVRLKQQEFWDIFEAGILPILRRLAPPDLGSRRRSQRPPELALFNRWSRSQATEAMDSLSLPALPVGCFAAAKGAGNGDPLPWESDLGAYHRSAQLQAGAIAHLTGIVRTLFPPTRNRRWEGPRTCGVRIRIRAVPQAEANPRQHLQIWERRSPPSRPLPHLTVLIDRSGSMDGDRMTAAFTGCVLVSEVCHRSGIPFSLFTFSNTCEEVVPWEAGLDDRQRGRMGGLAAAASGGTDMAGALRKVAGHLERSPHPHRVLIVLGDGDDGSIEVTAMARRIAQSGVHLVGLGVGPDTRAMEDCIPRARTCLQPRSIPGALAHALEEAVRLARG